MRATTEPFKVYWQPGCTSCLRAKELLQAHGIEFVSVNVRADPGAMAELAALGVTSVPVIARGRDFVHGQDLETVARFVGITLSRPRLSAPQLVARLLSLLECTAQLVAQLPADALPVRLPGRERTHLDLAYHVPQVVTAFLDAAAGGRLAYEYFERKPPASLHTAVDAADLIRGVSRALAAWWAANQSYVPQELDTYYGCQPLAAVLERTTWHVAQHARQLERLLELRGVRPTPGLPPSLLDDLPLPADVWDAEVPLA